MIALLLEEGDTASDIGTSHDDTPNGGLLTVLSISLHSDPIDATGRETLRDASGGTDGEVRSAINSVLGGGWAREWDDGPHQDSLHGGYVSGYVPVRTRIRAALARLP